MSRFPYTSPARDRAHPVTAPLRGGAAVLRPLLPGELEPQRAVFDAMSPDSRRARYLTPVSTLTTGMWSALTAVDGRHHVAWLASVDGRPAGIARYVHVAPCTAEIAFEVVDEQQGRGLGGVLLDTISTIAAASRVRRLQATVLAENSASRGLLAMIGLRLRGSGGVLEGESSFHLLERPRVDRPAVVGVAFAVREGGGLLGERVPSQPA
ncbi:GNAT family N-acetyltransferase [Nocardioides euryhalodurans]|uniref:GNAT family N-acetyltransferase n=1 Tax=Nocardioides euryhalodurans TaxID=2518370 RepID=A0A4P7GPY2_9ACTN|nr:GNAT family N-acetyltransferase [Nocardioides euryhalodurans]QBR93871.1 GNAT family N-acetyltransferase [Nocardioides euryhalodurans]